VVRSDNVFGVGKEIRSVRLRRERDDRHSVVDDHGSCKATPGWLSSQEFFALDCRLWEVSFV